MVFKRSQYVHNHIMLSGGGKHITYTSSSGALVLVWCGHSVTGMLFLTGLWKLCNWGLFCILDPIRWEKTLSSALEQEARPTVF